MKRYLVLLVAAVLVMVGTGCGTTTGGDESAKLSFNMTQSISRGSGDVAMTALLDQGVDPVKAKEYVQGLAELVGKGDVDKQALHDAAIALANKLKIKGAADYIDALLVVIPSHVKWNEKIPEQYRTALVSFLNDGAIRAVELYKPGK